MPRVRMRVRIAALANPGGRVVGGLGDALDADRMPAAARVADLRHLHEVRDADAQFAHGALQVACVFVVEE